MALNDLKCRSAKPRVKPYKLFDSEGLYLEVSPTGRKYWRLKFYFAAKEKRISFGVYPEVSLQKARLEMRAARSEIRNGVNPIIGRVSKRQTESHVSNQLFKNVAVTWHAKQLKQWDARYAQTILHRLNKYVFPCLGNYPMKDLKPLLILDCLQKIEKSAPEMARRVKGYIHLICIYAMTIGLIDQDPTYGLEHALEKFKRGHFASIRLEDLPKFIFDLHNNKAKTTRQTFLAIRLMFLTFIRTSELIKSDWTEIDFEKAIWSIPGFRMKKDRPHLVPLSKQALAILTELREINPYSKFIFPSIPKPTKHMSNGTILVALKRMGYGRRMTGHGFRALAMGILKEKLNYQHELVDLQLAHSKKGNDRAYDRSLYLLQRSKMMQKYANYLDEIYRDAILTEKF